MTMRQQQRLWVGAMRWLAGIVSLAVALAVTHAAPPPSAPPRPELLAPGVVSTGDDDAHATVFPDGEHLFFLKSSPDFAHWTALVADRRGEGWGEPRVAWFSGRYSDADISFAPDGETIYFISTRPATPGEAARDNTDLWRMRRRAAGAAQEASQAGWGEPEHLAALSSAGSEWFPNATADGWLYFGSERREGNLGREGTSDLWRARLAGDGFGPLENLGPVLNTVGNDIEPWVAADGSLMIFASAARPGSLGAYDLYASRRCDGTWTAPHNLGPAVNSPRCEFGARPTPDGQWLLFTSNRGFADQPLERALTYSELLARLHAPGNGLHDVYRFPFADLDLGPPCPKSSP